MLDFCDAGDVQYRRDAYSTGAMRTGMLNLAGASAC